MRLILSLVFCLAAASVVAADRSRDVQLIDACSLGNSQEARRLLSEGASPQASRPSGRTALHFAAASGDVSTIRLLIEHGADVQAVDGLGRSTLDEAHTKYIPEAVCVLLEAGCRPTERTRQLRMWKRREAGTKALTAQGANLEASLFAAAQDGHHDLVRTLLDRGADLHRRDAQSRTALHIAVGYSHPTIVELLIARGADPNALDDKQETPLHLHRANDLLTVQALVRGGAKLDLWDSYHHTPARHAAFLHRWEIYDWILSQSGGKEPLVARDPQSPLRDASVEGLLAILDRAEAKTDRLDRAQEKTYWAAAREFMARGPSVMPVLLQRLQKSESLEKRRGLLICLGQSAEAALPWLTQQLSDPRRVEHALSVMRQIRHTSVDELPVAVRAQAAEVLAGLLVKPRASEPKDQFEAEELRRQLCELGAPAVPTIVKLLEHRDPIVRLNLTTGMRWKIVYDPRIDAALVRNHRDKRYANISFQAALAMLKTPATQEEAKVALLSLMKTPTFKDDEGPLTGNSSPEKKQWHEDSLTAALAMIALGPAVLDDLVANFPKGSSWGRSNYVTTMYRLGPPAVPRLIELMAHEDPDVSSAATFALGQIGAVAVPELLLALPSDNEQTVLNALRALHGIYVCEDTTRVALLVITGDEARSDVVRLEAMLAALRPDRQSNELEPHRAALDFAQQLLKRGDYLQQKRSIEVIGSFGPAAIEARALLLPFTELADGPADASRCTPYDVKSAAVSAIRKIDAPVLKR